MEFDNSSNRKIEYLDPKAMYANALDSWEELWDDSISIFWNTKNILEQIVWLPNPKILNTLVAIYILAPTKWTKILPILFCYGEQGSGKSSTSIFANLLHGYTQTFSSADTFASIRNSLDNMRWIDPELKELEKEGAILCWDNINKETLLRDIKLYNMLLFGYNRSTEKVQIANMDGTNKEYKVFCPKILSSIESIHLDYQFSELRRRMMVIPHKQFEKFNYLDKEYYRGRDFDLEKLDLDSISWEGIETKFLQFWSNVDTCKEYVMYRKILTKRGNKPFEIPDSISSTQWTISIDLICTGLVLKAFDSINHALEFFAKYWEYSKVEIYSEFSATLEHLRSFIGDETESLKECNRLLVEKDLKPKKIYIHPKRLKHHLDKLQSEGALDIMPRPKYIQEIMNQLGWKLTTKGWTEK